MASLIRLGAVRYLSNSSVLAQAAKKSKGIQGPSAVSGGHEGGYKIWKKLTFLVAFPAIGLCLANCILAHQKEHHEQPKFVAYEHLRIRNKRFPWGEGQKSLFHNPHLNALPTGYEDVEE